MFSTSFFFFFLDKAKPVRITGHSLGGAAAAILGFRLIEEGLFAQMIPQLKIYIYQDTWQYTSLY